MENAEEVLQVLERFTKLKQKEIPKELDDYLLFVAKTGDTVYRWPMIKQLFHEKLVSVITDFHDTTPSIADLQYPNVDPFNYENMKKILLERLDSFNSAPFTVQRICELLAEPKKQYTRIDKFMRAVEKNILVVSTQEPGRVTESENGDSFESLANRELELDVDIDYDFDSIETPANNRDTQNNGLTTTNEEEASTSKDIKESESSVDPLLTDVKVDIITEEENITDSITPNIAEREDAVLEEKQDVEIDRPVEPASEIITSIISEPDKCLTVEEDPVPNIESLVSVTMSMVSDDVPTLATENETVAEATGDNIQNASLEILTNNLDLVPTETPIISPPPSTATTIIDDNAEVDSLIVPAPEGIESTLLKDDTTSSGSSSSSSDDFYSNLETQKKATDDVLVSKEIENLEVPVLDVIEKNDVIPMDNSTVLLNDVEIPIAKNEIETEIPDTIDEIFPIITSTEDKIDSELLKCDEENEAEEKALLEENPIELAFPPSLSVDFKSIVEKTSSDDISVSENLDAVKTIVESETSFPDITEINLPVENVMATDEEETMVIAPAPSIIEPVVAVTVTEEIEKDAMEVDESSGEPMDQ